MADSEKKPPKPTLWERLKKRFQISTALAATIVVGVLLLLVASLAWGLYSTDPNRIAWGNYMTVGQAAWLLLLWALSCLITYVSVRTWMNETPLIGQGDDAWNVGMRLLAKHGVKIQDLPCYLVLGCQTRFEQERWVHNEGLGTSKDHAHASSSIDWHLFDERILIFCRDVGVYSSWLKERAAEATQVVETTAAISTGPATGPSPLESDGAVASSSADTEPSIDSPGPRPSGSDTGTEPSVATKTLAAKPRLESAPHETLRLLDHADALVQQAQSIAPQKPKVRYSCEPLSSVKVAAAQKSLSRFCALLRSKRYPYSSINGTLVAIDSAVLDQDDRFARTAASSIRADLQLIESELGVQAPVAFAVAETQCQQDFVELGRRVGPPRDGSRVLLGQTFDPQAIPTADAMNGLADQAIASLRDQVNQIFKDPKALTLPQNHRLIRILVRSRRWRSSLRNLMVGAVTQKDESKTESSIVNGLFFVAPGQSPTLRSFVQAIFQQLDEQQYHLAWTKERSAQHAKQTWLVRILVTTTFLLLGLLVFQLWLLLT